MNDFVFSNNVFFSKIEKLVNTSKSPKKLVIINGNAQMGKTFTLKNIQKEILGKKLSMYLSLDKDNSANPLILKKAILQCIQKKYDAGEKPLKNDFKNVITSFLSGFSLKTNLPMAPIEVSYSTKDLVESLDKAIGGFKKEIENIPSPQNAYIEELVAITKAFCDASDEMLYLLIDDFQFISDEIRTFIKLLDASDVSLGIFLTAENYKSKQEAIDWIISAFLHDSERCIEDLKRFNEKTVVHYITKNADIPEELSITETAEKIFELTYGVPGYVSLLTNDIATLDKIEKNSSFEFVMNNRYNSLSCKEQEIVEMISILSNSIPSIIFDVINKTDSDEYDLALQSLLDKSIISEETDGYDLRYKLNFPAIVPKGQHTKKRKLAKKLFELFLMSKYEYRDEFNFLNYCLMLSLKIDDIENIYKYTCEFSDYLSKNFKYEKAIEILRKTIKNYNFSFSEQVNLKAKLVENLLRASQVEKIERLFNELSNQERDFIEKNYPHVFISIAQAFYYLNNPKKALRILQSLKVESETDKIEKIKLICSSLDLDGNYQQSKDEYYNFLKDKDNDEEAKYALKVYILMVEKDHSKCVDALQASINYFDSYPNKNNRTERLLATAYNNLGIEHLMNGNFKKSKINLEKSYEIFEKYRSNERIFSLNNQGLLNMFLEKYDSANDLFTKALENAISPLQKSYILQNIAIMLHLLNDKKNALKRYNEAKVFSEECPDPVVKNYTIFNGLYLKDEDTDAQSLSYLNKDQLELLNYKRKEYLPSELPVSSNSDRRTFFAKLEYEPCELMFYN